MEPTNQKAIFKNYDFREVLLPFMYEIIKGYFKSSQALKSAINKSYQKGGITGDQKNGLLMSLNLEGSVSLKRYTREAIYTLLEGIYKEHYITALDFNVCLKLAVSNELFSDFFISSKLVELPEEERKTEEELTQIVKCINAI